MIYRSFAQLQTATKNNFFTRSWIIAVIIVDRFTKFIAHYAATHNLFEKDFTSWLSFGYTVNSGISWGIFNSNSLFVTHCITAVLVVTNLVFLHYAAYQYKSGKTITGELLIIIGALSNLIDRFIYNGVIDFIVLHWHAWYWPSFNIADVAIVCGVFIIFYKELKAA